MYVLPTANPDQLTLFARKEVDAVWTVEPWVSRLERESNGKIFLEETDAVTTTLVSSRKFLEKQRDLARKIYAAHVELTHWIIAHPDEAQRMLQAEIAEETKAKIPIELIQKSWKRLVFTEKITIDPINKAVADAKAAGFIKDTVDMARILETP